MGTKFKKISLGKGNTFYYETAPVDYKRVAAFTIIVAFIAAFWFGVIYTILAYTP